MGTDIKPQAAADLRQALGEALTMKLADMCEGGLAPDWFDAAHVDEVLDVLMPLIAAATPSEPTAAPRVQPREIAERICRDVAELPDRSSPADWPEAMLVTAEELSAIVTDALAATVPWDPMSTAPMDGSPVLLLIEDNKHPLYDESLSVSIGSYGVEGGPEQDPTWHFAGWSWHHDCYCRGEGKPIGWLPIPGVTPTAAPLAANSSEGR